MPAAPPPGSGPRLTEAMPRLLLVVFLVFGLIALVGAVVLVIRPPRPSEISLGDRRPSPAPPLSHDALRVDPVLPPRVQPAFRAPCPEVSGMRVVAAAPGVARLTAMARHACRLTEGAGDDVGAAVRALSGVTVRFAAFRRSGTESTFDHAAGVLYLNVRFASTEIPVTHVVPVLLHDAAHVGILVRARAFSTHGPTGLRLRPDYGAEAELRARQVEVAACRNLIPAPEWPRWCHDARALTQRPAAEALTLLRAAGFA